MMRTCWISLVVGALLVGGAWGQVEAKLPEAVPDPALEMIAKQSEVIEKLTQEQAALKEKLGSLEASRSALEKSLSQQGQKFSKELGDVKQSAAMTGQELLESSKVAQEGTDLVWILLAAFLVMLMQAGFGLVEAGFTRAKNAVHTISLNFLDYCVAMLAYWAVGFAIMFGSSFPERGMKNALSIDGNGEYTLLGLDGWFLMGGEVYAGTIFAIFLFQLVFCNTANTIITGSLAERWKLRGFMVHAVLMAGLFYPIFGHWVWGGGWLSALGYVDFAGSTVVHMAGGVMALIAAYMVGPREGKFNEDGTSNPIPGHNLPMAFLGTFLLAFGWFGFNAGSTLSGTDLQIGIIAANTALASGAGAVAAALLSWYRFGKPDPSFMCNGMLGGLVGITAPCAFVDAWAAVLIGAISGVLVLFSVLFIEEVLRIDDPVGAASVHGTCGAFGGIAVGLFANGTYGGDPANQQPHVAGLFYGDMAQFGVQCLGVFVCFAFFAICAVGLFTLTNKFVGNRANEEEQDEGLDLSEFGVDAYYEEST